jgi:hypothetical protein
VLRQLLSKTSVLKRKNSGAPLARLRGRRRGKEKLREVYTFQFSNRGGIGLEHCTLTDDGVRCAIEYNCVRWGLPSYRRRWASRCMSAGAVGSSQRRTSTTTPMLLSYRIHLLRKYELQRMHLSTSFGPLLTRAQYWNCGQPVYCKAIRPGRPKVHPWLGVERSATSMSVWGGSGGSPVNRMRQSLPDSDSNELDVDVSTRRIRG